MSQNAVSPWVDLVRELWRFVWARKVWWLVPSLVLILLAGVLIVLGALTPLGPLMYTVF